MAGTEERDPLGKSWRTWGFILAGMLVVVIAGLVLAQLLPKQSNDQTLSDPSGLPTPAATSTAPETAGGTPSSTSTVQSSIPGRPNAAGDCPPMSANNRFPVEAPAAEWETHPSGTFLPVSKDFGPGKRDGKFWRCFSHTTTGATFAGITLLTDFLSGHVLESAVSSKRRDELFGAQAGETVPAPRITGYKVVTSSANSATINYLYESEDGPAGLKVRILWDKEAGDWRLDMEEFKIETGIDPDTYTPWGGQ